MNDIWTFDLHSNHWEPITTQADILAEPRSEFASTRVGEILIVFGGISDSVLLGDMHYFNFRTQELNFVEPRSVMSPSRRKGSCMAAAGENIFIFGGITNEGYSDELWLFDSGSSTYTLLKTYGEGPTKTARGNCKAYVNTNNEVIFETYIGETVGRQPLSSIYSYNYTKNTWTCIKQHTKEDFSRSQAAALYMNDKLLVAGGAFRSFLSNDHIHFYDLKTKTTELAGKLPHRVFNAGSVFYENKLYIYGGQADFNGLPLVNKPRNDLIVIELSDECTNETVFCNENCSPGSYFDGKSCKSCPSGSFVESIGAMKCELCPVDRFSDTLGADSYRFCKPCTPRTYTNSKGQSACKDCPGNKICSSMNQFELDLYKQMKTPSIQPDLFSTREEEVSNYSQIFNLSLGLSSSILLILLLSFSKTREFITNIDYYQLHHNYILNEYMIIKKTFIGGIATSVYVIIAVSIIFSMGLSYGLDNIAETKALVPEVILEQEYGEIYAREIEFSFSFAGYGGECGDLKHICINEIRIDTSNLIGDISDLTCIKEAVYCIVTFKCTHCKLISTGSITLVISESESYATHIGIEISSTSSIPNEISHISTVIAADPAKYFRGADPSIAYLTMTPSLFLNDSGDWDNEQKGYHVSYKRDSTPGSQIQYSE